MEELLNEIVSQAELQVFILGILIKTIDLNHYLLIECETKVEIKTIFSKRRMNSWKFRYIIFKCVNCVNTEIFVAYSQWHFNQSN